ncbi:PREDICTED: uncharacterized protein LOC104594368 isoform X2 [Nelumbo nucifera]|uniref:Uncharacterized protein LOC104594368 isoform X2 n=1 Tax=Nelumbo nucifera TaxID=4432 RepID=A0A1U7ZWR0_NELNU|nr:PREDICTED: uncharacterized protein LOC104594368 isoform X2 [Nelumbo nucifera]
MEQIESEIRRVLEDHHRISSNVRSEEAKIEELNKEIGLLEDRIRGSGLDELERQRLQNLLNYQATLIARAASRTEVIRALHDDLLGLFVRRKQLRQSDSASRSGVDVVPNISLSSGLSSGDDDNNQVFPNDCSMPGAMDIMRMSDDHGNLEEETTTEQDQIPLGLKMLQINMNEDACLTPEDGSEYGDFHYKNNILDNIAMSILDPNANVDTIFKEAMENSDFPQEETQGSKRVPKRAGQVASRNLAKRLIVDFDEVGNPTGPNAGAFKRSINSYVCHFLPVRFKQIGDVPVEDYKSVLNMLTERYNFDINRSYTRKKISSCYRQHKYKLLIQIKKDLERGVEPQKPSYVKKEDWDAFVAKTKDEEFDKISKKNKASRSHQSAMNRKGLSPSVHKRKLKGSELGSADDCVWSKTNKPKRGRPKKLLPMVEDNNNIEDTMGLPADQEEYNIEFII